jgi:hypothetical protein
MAVFFSLPPAVNQYMFTNQILSEYNIPELFSAIDHSFGRSNKLGAKVLLGNRSKCGCQDMKIREREHCGRCLQ